MNHYLVYDVTYTVYSPVQYRDQNSVRYAIIH